MSQKTELGQIKKLHEYTGSTPEGATTGAVGDVAIGSSGIYQKTSGTGNTGWTKMSTDSVPTVTDSDGGFKLLSINPTGNVRTGVEVASLQIVAGAGAPTNGTTKAWYTNQPYLDTTNKVWYYASTKSTDPDAAATGSVWTQVSGSADNLGDGLSASQDLTDFSVGIRSSNTTYNGVINVTAANNNTNTNSGMVSVYGKDHATRAGDVVISAVDEFVVQTGATPAQRLSITANGGLSYSATVSGGTTSITAAPNGATSTLTLSAFEGANTAIVTLQTTRLTLNAPEYKLGGSGTTNRPTLDSDASQNLIGRSTSDGLLKSVNVTRFEVLSGAGAPTNGTTVAWYVNQLYVDTTNNALYIATTKSTDPDSAGTGSVWAAVPVAGTDTLGTGLTSTQDVTSFLLGINSSNTTYNGVMQLSAANNATNTNSGLVSVYGKDHGSKAGDVEISAVNDFIIYTGATPTQRYAMDANGSIIHTAINAGGTIGRVITANGASSSWSTTVGDGTNTGVVTINPSGITINNNQGVYELGSGGSGNPVTDSDAASMFVLTHISSTSRVNVANANSFRTITSGAQATSGSTIAWYAGQLHYDSNIGQIQVATTKSTNPDSAATGSVWTPVIPIVKSGTPSGSFTITKATHGTMFTLVPSANVTMNEPSGYSIGETFEFWVEQGATGYTFTAWTGAKSNNSSWISSVANRISYVRATYVASGKWYCVVHNSITTPV